MRSVKVASGGSDVPYTRTARVRALVVGGDDRVEPVGARLDFTVHDVDLARQHRSVDRFDRRHGRLAALDERFRNARSPTRVPDTSAAAACSGVRPASSGTRNGSSGGKLRLGRSQLRGDDEALVRRVDWLFTRKRSPDVHGKRFPGTPQVAGNQAEQTRVAMRTSCPLIVEEPRPAPSDCTGQSSSIGAGYRSSRARAAQRRQHRRFRRIRPPVFGSAAMRARNSLRMPALIAMYAESIRPERITRHRLYRVLEPNVVLVTACSGRIGALDLLKTAERSRVAGELSRISDVAQEFHLGERVAGAPSIRDCRRRKPARPSPAPDLLQRK